MVLLKRQSVTFITGAEVVAKGQESSASRRPRDSSAGGGGCNGSGHS